mmetsp:Transcript_19845/g.32013  ORF Transcript_19845/g.32013 Transcript_19845/m.32013 type:complete len:183 (+) Transcript_19845:49-597(+)
MKETDNLIINYGSAPASYTYPRVADDRLFVWSKWIIIVLQLLSVVILLLGQTLAIFFYDLAVQMRLQEDGDEVGPAVVQINRAYGMADTILYIPIIVSSVLGLTWKKRRESIICTAASAGIHSYWSIQGFFTYIFEATNDVPGWTYNTPVSAYLFCLFYFCFGIGVLTFLYVYMDLLLSEFS